MSSGADACRSPVRRPVSRHSLNSSLRSPVGSWYADVPDHARGAMSSATPPQPRSHAVYGRPDNSTPRHVAPSTPMTVAGASNTNNGNGVSGGGPMSPRHAVISRRRYQVVTGECSAYPPRTPTRVVACYGRAYSSAFFRPGGVGSPARRGTTNTASSVTTQMTSHQSPLLDVIAAASTTSGGASRPLSARQPYPQHRPQYPQPQKPHESPQQQIQHATSGQKLREIRIEDDSIVTSSRDLFNTEEGFSSMKMLNQKPYTWNGQPRVVVSQLRKDLQTGDSSEFTPLTIEPISQQFVQRGGTPTAYRIQRGSIYNSLHASTATENNFLASSQRSELNCTLNREFPIQESLYITPHRKTTPAVKTARMYSSMTSATVQRCLNVSTANKSSPQPITAPGSTTQGTTPAQSDDGSRSSTETLNLINRSSRRTSSIYDSGISFVSSRPLVQQILQRWRNHYEENKNAYCEGGYMTVIPGKKLNSRYVVVQKLGWGEFSTVWLAYDTMHKTLGKSSQAFVALKIAKCDHTVSASTQYEISLLRYIGMQTSPVSPLTSLVDFFEVSGQYGSHVCMVMPLHGSNLLSIIDQMKAKKGVRSQQEIRLIKEITASVLLGLQELDELDIIHTDIKPENVLYSSPDPKVLELIEVFCRRNKERSSMVSFETVRDSMVQGNPNHLVCLADFGLSVILKPNNEKADGRNDSNTCQSLLTSLIGKKKEFPVEKAGVVTNLRGTMIQTREYRAPEIIIGLDFNTRTDLWSVGCMVFELITGDFLMDPKRRTKNERMMDVEHLAMMMQLLGPVPDDIICLRTQCDPRRPPPRYIHRYFNESGRFIYADKYRLYPRRHLDKELEPYLQNSEAKGAADFIMRCLSSFDPAKRPSVHEMFNHSWLSDVMGQRKC